MPQIAAPFGKYLLLRRIAVGGMAELFLAVDTTTDRQVVIKRILPYLSHEPEFVQMFLDEARIAAQLHHPNIIQVHELGKLQDSIFISMEYVDGVDLRKILQEEAKQGLTIPYGIAAYVTAQVAAGLFHAHNTAGVDGKPLGLIHRDVSPQNVMVAFDGRVKLVDFGIAKAGALVERSKPGVIKGKFLYLSPEQLSQERVDHRADLFALGTMLYEITTGKSPFSKPTTEAVIYAIRSEEPPPPALLRSGYPEELSRIVMRCLAKDRNRRYPQAAEVQHDLEALIARQFPTDAGELAGYLRRLFGAEDESTRVHAMPSGAGPRAARDEGTKVEGGRRPAAVAQPPSASASGARAQATMPPPTRRSSGATFPSAGERPDLSVTHPPDGFGASEPAITLPPHLAPPPPPVAQDEEESEQTVPLSPLRRRGAATAPPLGALEPVFDTGASFPAAVSEVTPRDAEPSDPDEATATADPAAARRMRSAAVARRAPARPRVAVMAAVGGAAAVVLAALAAWWWIDTPDEASARVKAPEARGATVSPALGVPADGAATRPRDPPSAEPEAALAPEAMGGPAAEAASMEPPGGQPPAALEAGPATRPVVFVGPRGTVVHLGSTRIPLGRPYAMTPGDVTYAYRCAGRRTEQRAVVRVVAEGAGPQKVMLACRSRR